jgi:hypothetical protein
MFGHVDFHTSFPYKFAHVTGNLNVLKIIITGQGTSLVIKIQKLTDFI